jgi:hypothetical protein
MYLEVLIWHQRGMGMQIVVNHLTRMQTGHVCVAGINPSNAQHIRPVRRSERLTRDLLALNGGPFSIASLVDLGPVQYCGKAPELEDHRFDSANARNIGIISPERFWQLLQSTAHTSIVDIFGPAIQPFRNGCIVDVGTGKASLGCLIPANPPKLSVNRNDRIRADITDGTFTVNLSVTDLRLHEADHKTPKWDLIREINARIQSGTPVILSIGLARPWKHHDDTVERHWLQVNNFHLRDYLVW